MLEKREYIHRGSNLFSFLKLWSENEVDPGYRPLKNDNQQPTTVSVHAQHTNYTLWERVSISEPFVRKEQTHFLFSSTTLAIFLLTFLCPGWDITPQVLSYDPSFSRVPGC